MSDEFCDADDDNAWNEQRIVATKAMIIATEAAILALSNGAQSYQLDTGQSRQLVTKANIASLRLNLLELESRLDTYRKRRCGVAHQVRPGW